MELKLKYHFTHQKLRQVTKISILEVFHNNKIYYFFLRNIFLNVLKISRRA